MDLGLATAEAVGVAKALMVEGCLAIGGRVAMQGLAELLGCMAVGR